MTKAHYFIIVLLAAAMVFAGRMSIAGAATTSAPSASALAAATTPAESLITAARQLSESPRLSRKDLTARLATIDAALTNGRLVSHAPRGALLDKATAAGWRLKGGTELVRLALRGGGVIEPSALSVAFRGGVQLTSAETAFSPMSANSGTVRMWVNNNLVLAKTVVAPPTRGVVQPHWSFNGFQQCLRRQGVPFWVIWAVGAACATACLVSAGTGCLACLFAADGLDSGIIAYCLTHTGG